MSGATILDYIKTVLYILTGCGCFLIGIQLMSRGFLKYSKSKNGWFARKFRCKNAMEGYGAGIMYAGVVQSSDVTELFLIELLDAGYITLSQSFAVSCGANVGTCLTSFIIAFSTFDFSVFFAAFSFIGAMMMLIAKNPKTRIIGEIFAGFGLIFVGTELLKVRLAVGTIAGDAVAQLFSATTNPFLLMLIGACVTAVMQSSSVSTAILVLMSANGLVPVASCLYLILGINVGTCFTGFLASLRRGVNAKREAFMHMFFNLMGALVFFFIIYYLETGITNFFGKMSIIEGLKVALAHLMFNLGASIIMLPLMRPTIWLSKKIIKRKQA